MYAQQPQTTVIVTKPVQPTVIVEPVRPMGMGMGMGVGAGAALATGALIGAEMAMCGRRRGPNVVVVERGRRF